MTLSTTKSNSNLEAKEAGVPLSDSLVDIVPQPTTTKNNDDDDDLDIDTVDQQESFMNDDGSEESVRVLGHVQEYLLKMQKQVVDDLRELGEPCQYNKSSGYCLLCFTSKPEFKNALLDMYVYLDTIHIGQTLSGNCDVGKKDDTLCNGRIGVQRVQLIEGWLISTGQCIVFLFLYVIDILCTCFNTLYDWHTLSMHCE